MATTATDRNTLAAAGLPRRRSDAATRYLRGRDPRSEGLNVRACDSRSAQGVACIEYLYRPVRNRA